MHLSIARTEFEKGIVINNSLRNNRKNHRIQNKLLAEFSLDQNISDLAIRVSGFANDIAEFKCGKAATFKQAEKAIETIASSNDTAFIAQVLASNEENEFFSEMVSNIAKDNPTLNKVWTSFNSQDSCEDAGNAIDE